MRCRAKLTKVPPAQPVEESAEGVLRASSPIRPVRWRPGRAATDKGALACSGGRAPSTRDRCLPRVSRCCGMIAMEVCVAWAERVPGSVRQVLGRAWTGLSCSPPRSAPYRRVVGMQVRGGVSGVGSGGWPGGLGRGAGRSPAWTPGAINPDVTQGTIGMTICVRGWTRSLRPPREYTSALNRQQLCQWGYADRRHERLRGGSSRGT